MMIPSQNLKKSSWHFPWSEPKFPGAFKTFHKKFFFGKKKKKKNYNHNIFQMKIIYFNFMIIRIWKKVPFLFLEKQKCFLTFPDHFIYSGFPQFSSLVGTLIFKWSCSNMLLDYFYKCIYITNIIISLKKHLLCSYTIKYIFVTINFGKIHWVCKSCFYTYSTASFLQKQSSLIKMLNM